MIYEGLRIKIMKQPEIRFNGFSDEWTDVVLKDTMSKISLKNKDLDVIYVESISNIKGFIPQTSQFGDRLVASKDLSNYTVVTEGDIAYNPSRINVGSIALKEAGSQTSVISPLYVAFRVKDDMLSPQFLMNWLNTTKFDRQRSNASEGGVRDTLSYGSFSKFKIQLPSLPEQQKIGALFSKYDAIIALYEQKLEELNALKKGLLQQMFDDGVATSHKPQVRFSGFNDDWVEKKLGEIGLIQTGNTPSTSEFENYSEDGLLWITPTDITSSYVVNSHKRLSKIGEKKSRIADAGSILVTSIASIGKNTIIVERAAFNQQINALTPTLNNDSYFLLAQSKQWSYKMKQIASNGTMSIVNKSIFSNIRTYVPSLPEQQKIGQLFKQLDDRISNEQSKIEQLKAQKQGLLQRML